MPRAETIDELCRLHVRHVRVLRDLTRATIPRGEESVLLWLADAGAKASAGELAAGLGLTPGSVANLCRSLEDKGLVYRRRDGVDARRVHVTLTDEGRARAARALARMEEWEQRLLSSLDEDEADDFVALVDRILTGAQRLELSLGA